MDWQELEKKYYMQVVKRLPVTLVKGAGARVWDEKGKEYLDFVAGWATNLLGHCHPAVVEAVTRQVATLIQTSNQFYTTPQVQLAELLVQNSCLQRVFLANSGAEANEGAVKLARRYGQLKLGGAYEVITTFNSFHGRTLAMTAATGQKKFQDPYRPVPEGFVNVEFNNIEAIRSATTERTCAVMLEPIQGEGGVNIPHRDYLKRVRAWCDEKGLLLILDEIQTGLGRTGTLFAYTQAGIEPDIMTLAKGLAGGVPIGALLAKEQASVFAPGEHGSTYGGNPLAAAAGYATLKHIIDHRLPEKAASLGGYFISRIEDLKREFSIITEARGRGLLLALFFGKDIAGELTTRCLERGLLVNPVKPNALRFMPPLIINEKDIDEAVGVLRDCLAGLVGSR
ncbi:MAG: aspartate aminotransferase family protein [Chloroflexi bacterium]|nr:aspartate aminotransferase family protein [Chloroflexota bacterium]